MHDRRRADGVKIFGSRRVLFALAILFRPSARLRQRISAGREYMPVPATDNPPVRRAVVDTIQVFAIVGWFLGKAALEYDPKKAVGIGGALAKLARAPYGGWVLGVTAAGLLAFGIFCLAQACAKRFLVSTLCV